ncbi:MAG: hypothetical protein JWO57_931 [Pseudonocardiales bacterium]|nr:hypothetical protein [Pseudonocardiales bacterium]
MFGQEMIAMIAEQHIEDLRRSADEARLATLARASERGVHDRRGARSARAPRRLRTLALTRWVGTALAKCGNGAAHRKASADTAGQPAPAALLTPR